MRYSQFASYWQVMTSRSSRIGSQNQVGKLKLSCHNWFYSVNVRSQLSVRTRCSLTVEATLNSSMPESMVRPASVPNTTGCFTDGLMSYIPGVWQIGWWLISWMWLFWAWNWIWIPLNSWITVLKTSWHPMKCPQAFQRFNPDHGRSFNKNHMSPHEAMVERVGGIGKAMGKRRKQCPETMVFG